MADRYSHCVAKTQATGSVNLANGTVQQADIGKCSFTFSGTKFEQSVGVMPFGDAFDMVLGQDWLTQHSAVLSFDRNDPDFKGLDDRHVSFVNPKNGKRTKVPLPSHLREMQLNSVVRNIAA